MASRKKSYDALGLRTLSKGLDYADRALTPRRSSSSRSYNNRSYSSSRSSSSEGCYIATSIYGSYDCPQVWVLRRYRDNVLYSTRRGRLFIKFYYAVSPTFVKLFGETRFFKVIFTPYLDKKVARLKENGFEDTAYYDLKG